MKGARLSSRTRFILQRGVFPWGLVGGGAAAVITVPSVLHARSSGDGIDPLAVALLAVLVFLIWTTIVGWIVGGIRWMLREPPPRRRQ